MFDVLNPIQLRKLPVPDQPVITASTATKVRPVIIIPVHNRRATTLKCLDNLRDDGVFDWSNVIVVDDGSTDGTADAVRQSHANVTILVGDGSLWWGGAINLGMAHALAGGAPHVIWLNDDCLPRPGCLRMLWQTSQERAAITVARTFLIETGELGYSGMERCPKQLLCMVQGGEGEVTPCATFAGNCVVIPTDVVRRLGGIDTRLFPHARGDVDFGLRATDIGVPAFVVGNACCDSTYGYLKNRMSWWFGEVGIGELWDMALEAPNGVLSTNQLRFAKRHHGLAGIYHYLCVLGRLCAVSVVRSVIPSSILRRFAHLSVAHARMERVKAASST